MLTKTSLNTFASAGSLLAITIGAVSAALIVMCIGMYVIIISVDTSANVNVPAAAVVPMPRPFAVALSGDQLAGEEAMSSPHLSDALFHEGAEMTAEESGEVPAVYSEPLLGAYLVTASVVSCAAHCRAAKGVTT